MKRYDSYKDSGVKWLGEIPAHWESKPFDSIFNQVSFVNQVEEQLLSVYLDKGVIRFSDVVQKRTNVTSEDLSKYQLVEEGDFVLNNQQAWRGSVGVSFYRGIVSPAYIVLKPKSEYNAVFFNYMLRNRSNVNHYLVCSKGVGTIQRNLYWPSLKRVYLHLPPIYEQQAIAEFLDDKTTKIDQAIAIKEKEIDLLKERRQILIQELVTGKKVWDGTEWTKPTETKDSGVDWIGEIPEDWEVRKVTYLFRKIGSGTTPTSGDLRYYDGSINFLQTGDLTDSYIVTTSKTLKEKALRDFTSLKLYPKGSLVIAMYGATIGKLGILDIETTTNQACCVLSDPRNILTKYFFFILLGFRKEIISLGFGGGQPNISQDLIKSLRFPIATTNAQERIVERLEDFEEKTQKAISLKHQEIDKLKEYKTVLIDNVVTGKIKVS